MPTKIQSPGVLLSGLLMALIAVFPINRSEAHIKSSGLSHSENLQIKESIPKGEMAPGKTTRPVEKPGPTKPQKPVIARNLLNRF